MADGEYGYYAQQPTRTRSFIGDADGPRGGILITTRQGRQLAYGKRRTATGMDSARAVGEFNACDYFKTRARAGIAAAQQKMDGSLALWESPTMIMILDAKRRLTVPAALAPTAPGDAFEARFDAEENEIVFRRIAGTGDWLAILGECPVSMDDLPRRRKAAPRRRRL